MTFDQFLTTHDIPDAVVLLEGKREVKPEDQGALTLLGRLLATKTKHMTFRSGNAAGSDEYFSKGVAEINSDRLEVVTPYEGHRKKYNQASTSYALDEINLAEEPDVVAYSKSNKKASNLIDRYIDGDRGRFAIKAAYLLRDTVKATGTKNIPAATFGLFYDDLSNPKSGGTGHTMIVCEELEIPYLTQEVWMKWLK